MAYSTLHDVCAVHTSRASSLSPVCLLLKRYLGYSLAFRQPFKRLFHSQERINSLLFVGQSSMDYPDITASFMAVSLAVINSYLCIPIRNSRSLKNPQLDTFIHE